MKLSDGGAHQGSFGQEDQSTATQNSNNTDLNSKVRRTTSGGAFNYIERGQAEEIYQSSEMAMYQADLNEMNNDKPKWFYQFSKNKK